jgi:hypothetical protein
MAETVNVAGQKMNRNVLVFGGAAAAGVVLYLYWRRATQPAPIEEGAYSAGDTWSPDAYTGAGTPAPGGETYDPNDVVERWIAPITNSEWYQRVVNYLSGPLGYEPQFAASTIGKYLSGQALTAAEKLLVQAGIGSMGNPPAGNLPIISAPEPTAPTPTTTTLGKPTLRWSAGDPRNTNYALSWSKVSGAAYYLLQRYSGPGSPTSITVIGTSRRTPPLKRGATYSYRVKAISVNPAVKSSDWSNTARFTVPRS